MRPSSPPSKCLAQLGAANGHYDYAVWQHVEDSEQRPLPSTWSFAFLPGCFILATQFFKLLNQEVRESRIVPAVDQVVVVRLARDLASGRVVTTLVDRDFDVPTTIAAWRGNLYAVNARFSTPPPPTTRYDIGRVG